MKSRKLNVLFLSGWYPNRVFPSLGNFVQKHAEAVALKSNVVALNICSDSNCKETFELVENRINNVHTINIYYKKVTANIPLVSNLQKLIRWIRAFSIGFSRAKNALGNIDIIHHNITYPAGIASFYVKKKLNVPYILSEHSTGYLPSKKIKFSSFELFLSGLITRNASFISPVSMDLKNAMQHLGLKGNYRIVYNVVDTKLFYPGNNRNHDRIKFLHISTLDDAHKNITGMLQAIARISQRRTDLQFLFAGDGDIKPHIETAKDLNIYNTAAFFEGSRSTGEIADLMRESDCFMMFSNYENLPVVIIEALASGLPVISSNVGGIHEHIDKSKGILVTPNDIAAFESAIEEMTVKLKNDYFDRKSLHNYACENFSYETVSEKFHQLYQMALKENV